MKQEGLPGGFLSHIFSKKPSSKQGKGFSAPCGWTALRRLIVLLRERDGIFHRGRGASAGGRRGLVLSDGLSSAG